MKWLIISILLISGCAHPEGIREDSSRLLRQNKAAYEFNLKMLDRMPANSEIEFAKKMALREIINAAYYRGNKALELLAEYLDSTELIDEEDEATLRNFAGFLADEIDEK